MKCLLCNSDKTIINESHPIAQLQELWNTIEIDVSTELKKPTLNVYYCPTCTLKFYDPDLAGGDKFYSELGKLDWYYLHPGKTEYDYVQKYINDGHKILDIGAGRGVLYTKIKSKVDYVGLELSTQAVKLAQESGINVIQEDLSIHAENNKNKYDRVCLFQVLEHLTEIDHFIKSVYLSLKDNGLFIIAVPDNEGFISFTPNTTFNLPPHHTILWTEKSLRYLAKKYNFEVVEVQRELLQDVHKEHVYQSYLAWIAKKIFYIPIMLLDNTKKHKVISRIVNKIYTNNQLKKLIHPIVAKRQQNGQSIIITLKK